MIIDFRTHPDLVVDEQTTVIVGSGAAGLALAGQLASHGRPVVLLESGGDVGSPPSADELNEGSTSGLKYDGLTMGRTRTFGGAAQLWHGQCMRLHEIDVQQRSWVANSGWPIELAQLDPFFAQAEAWFEISGNGYDRARWEEHPSLAPLEWDDEKLLHDFTEYTPHPMLGRRHRSALAADPNVSIVLNATVSAVLVEDGRVAGVEIRAVGDQRASVRCAQVVLAAGAIENARILQLSDPLGVGLGDGAEHTGRYLQDHPIIRTAEVIAPDFHVLQDRYVALHRGKRRLFPKVRLAPAAQEEFGLLDATAVFVHDHPQPALAAARRLLNAARSHKRPERPWRDALTALRAPIPVARDAYRRYARGLATGARPSAIWLQIWLEQAPDPDRRITLGSEVDSLGLRRADVHWSCSDQELETSRAMTRWIAEDLQRLGIARVRELAPMTDDDAWRAAVTDAFHPAGTTRMSDRPEDGVVDTDLQVHGVDGLYVVGGSVLPTSGYANPTLTIVALALRLATHLTSQPALTP